MSLATILRRALALVCLVACGLVYGAPRGAAEARAQDAARELASVRRAPVHVVLAGELSASSLSLLRRAIDAAKDDKRVVILELDTPGGEVTLMWKIARAIDAARNEHDLEFVAFVNEQALSAGSLIAMSCGEIHMSPGARIGAATPITIGMQGVEKAEEKFLSAFRAEWRAWAERHRRPPALAEGMVDEKVEVLLIEVGGMRRIVNGTEWDDLRARGEQATLVRTIADDQTLVALTAAEALEYGFSDGTSANFEELVEVVVGARLDDVLEVRPTESERFVTLLAPLAPFLLVIGIALALMELQAPGFGLAGAGSIAAFTLLLASRYLTGLAGFEHIAAIALGLALIAVEIFFVPGTFVAGISGALLFVWGLVASQLGPGFDFNEFALDRRLLYSAVTSTLGWTLVAMLASMALGRLLPRTPLGRFLVNDPQGAPTFAAAVKELDAAAGAARIGALATTTTALRPVGRVALDGVEGREFEAHAPGFVLEPRVRVRVVAIDTGRIVVEPLERPSAPTSSTAPLDAQHEETT